VPNIYEMLIGAGPQNEEQLRTTADALRQKDYMSKIGMLTGDDVLAPFGKVMGKQTDEQVKDLQGVRQFGITEKRARDALNSADEYHKALLKIQQQKADQEGSYRKALAAAKVRGTYAKPSFSMLNDVSAKAETVAQVGNLLSGFQDKYTKTLGNTGPLNLLPNALAQRGIGTEASLEANDWWGNWQMNFTLPLRNQLFGATLTANEQAAWEGAGEINPSMDPNIVRQRIQTLKAAAESRLLRDARIGISAGYDPMIYQSAMQESGSGIDLSGVMPKLQQEALYASQEAMGVEDLSEDELIEFQQLQQQVQQLQQMMGN
jgi:hypothetical protein